MPATPNGIPYPSGSDVPDVPYWNQQMAEHLDPMAAFIDWSPIVLDPAWEEKSGDAEVCRIGRVVYLSGLIGMTSGTIPANTNVTVGNLNDDRFEPRQSEWFGCGTTTGQPTCTVVITVGGEIQVRTPDAALSYVGLGSISFPARSA